MSVASRIRERDRFERVHGVRPAAHVKIWKLRQEFGQAQAKEPRGIVNSVAYVMGSIAAFGYLAAQDIKRAVFKSGKRGR